MKGIIFFIVLTTLIACGVSVYGAVLAFQASIILGITALLLEPSYFIIGILALCGHPEICSKVAEWLHLPF